uniref:Uncharacterized protein n=1 Tax=Anguilla anguilla TaxID=7936 RepID=A0A0E9Q1L6_ANGAN
MLRKVFKVSGINAESPWQWRARPLLTHAFN